MVESQTATDNATPAGASVEPIIQVRDLYKSFGSQQVLAGINLNIYPGEIMVLMGGSGCGKSTLLNHLIGELTPDQGSVRIFGREITDMGENNLNDLRKKFGILFQSAALFNAMTVGENVALPLREHTDLDPRTIEIIVKIKLEMVGLREHADKMPAQLSGGMKKRAGLARALALDPKILYYDEPSAGLDPVTSAQIDQLIVDLTRKLQVTSVVVTHEMDSAFCIADRMCMLDQGRALKIGSRAEFQALRDAPENQVTDLQNQLIRQFLRGEADGPLTQRLDAGGYERDILAV